MQVPVINNRQDPPLRASPPRPPPEGLYNALITCLSGRWRNMPSLHPFLVFVMLFWFIRQIPLSQKGPRHLSGDLTVPATTAITGSERLL